MAKKLAFFYMKLGRASELIEGKLLLIDTEKSQIDDQFIVTSGLPGFQYWEAQFRKGAGCIPRCDQAKIPHYRIKTDPIFLANKGIEGNFYPIFPHMVVAGGVERGDFGVHFDANVPGSLGCIGIRNKPAWGSYQAMMKNYLTAGIEEVPLIVDYIRS